MLIFGQITQQVVSWWPDEPSLISICL